MELAARVAPLTLARDRALPVAEPLAPFFPDGTLVRGRVVGCAGCAATTLALTVAADATTAGSWLAVVGIPSLGVDAAGEAGVVLERLVAIDADPANTAEWAERVAAAIDGFDLVLTRPPARPGQVVSKLRRRVQSRGAVLLLLGERRAFAADQVDMVLETVDAEWDGLGDGHGHLRRRRVVVSATGRRAPRPVERDLWLPGSSGAVESVTVESITVESVTIEHGTVERGDVESPALERAG